MDTVELIINVVAIILAPIIAVIIGQFLQNSALKRKDKIEIFKTLMAYRNLGYKDSNSVRALNLVPILFIKDKKVMESYNEFVKLMNREQKDQDTQNEIAMSTKKMLSNMAKSLHYKKVDWEVISVPYLPPEVLKNQKLGEEFVEGFRFLANLARAFGTNEFIGKTQESLDLALKTQRMDLKERKSKKKK